MADSIHQQIKSKIEEAQRYADEAIRHANNATKHANRAIFWTKIAFINCIVALSGLIVFLIYHLAR